MWILTTNKQKTSTSQPSPHEQVAGLLSEASLFNLKLNLTICEEETLIRAALIKRAASASCSLTHHAGILIDFYLCGLSHCTYHLILCTATEEKCLCLFIYKILVGNSNPFCGAISAGDGTESKWNLKEVKPKARTEWEQMLTLPFQNAWVKIILNCSPTYRLLAGFWYGPIILKMSLFDNWTRYSSLLSSTYHPLLKIAL